MSPGKKASRDCFCADRESRPFLRLDINSLKEIQSFFCSIVFKLLKLAFENLALGKNTQKTTEQPLTKAPSPKPEYLERPVLLKDMRTIGSVNH
jgi:hypothetical protein